MSARFCNTCGRSLDEKSVYCAGCGTRVPDEGPQARVCPSCSAELDDASPFCWKCGTAVAATSGGIQRSMDRRDEEISRLFARKSPKGSRLWKVLTVVLAASTAALLLLLVTPYGDELLQRPGVVTLSAITLTTVYLGNSSGYFDSSDRSSSCSASAGSSPCSGQFVTKSTIILFFTLTNTGSVSHSAGGFTVSSPFSIVQAPQSGTIGAFASVVSGIAIKAPSTAGSYSITITFYSN